MKFAQFQSTYKPLPTSTYETTGQILEAKYFKNREESTLLRQAMANSKVEDRNLGHLAKATTDVENILGEVNGKWHYAGAALYNAKERLVNDKALGASIEDYAKSQATKSEQQKRFEEGKIGQEALDAFYTYDKMYNSKAIEVDANGGIKNRWITPPPPEKPDIDKMAMDQVTLLLQHPDSVDSGLKSILTANGMDSGYLQRIRTEGVSDNKIYGLVKGWLANSDEVKNYYSYVNNADLLGKTAYTDENGNIVRKSVLPMLVSEYRNMGWNVDENGNLLDNYQHYINDRGEFDILKDEKGQSVTLKNAPKSLLDSADIKYLVDEKKMNVEDALRETYLSHKMDSQLSSIANNYRQFAFSRIADVDTLEDKAYWLNESIRREQLASAALNVFNTDKAPAQITPYSIRDAQGNSDQLQERINQLKQNKNYESDPNYVSAMDALNNQTKNITMISSTFAGTNEGKNLIASQWSELVKNLPKTDQENLRQKYYDKFIGYLTGVDTLPDTFANDLIQNTKQNKGIMLSGGSGMPTSYSTNNISKEQEVESYKIAFQKAIDKAYKNGLPVSNDYVIFRDKKQELSPFHTQKGEYIKTHGNSYTLPYNINKQGEPVKFQDYINEVIGKTKYHPDQFDVQWFPMKNNAAGFGEGVVKLVPNKNFPAGSNVPELDPIVIRPDAEIKNENLRFDSEWTIQNTDNPDIANWAGEGLAMSTYGDAFAPLFNTIAANTAIGGSPTINDSRTIVGVPFGGKSYTMNVKPELDSQDNPIYRLYIDPQSAKRNGVTSNINEAVAEGYSIRDLIMTLYTQNSKIGK